MQMIIASRLTDGRVVFMGETGAWVESIQEGVTLKDDVDAAQFMSKAQQSAVDNVVVDPYLINVVLEKGEPRPAHVREAIRAFGPSVRTDLGQRVNDRVPIR